MCSTLCILLFGVGRSGVAKGSQDLPLCPYKSDGRRNDSRQVLLYSIVSALMGQKGGEASKRDKADFVQFACSDKVKNLLAPAA
jgi:hypothetical protein